MDGVDLTRTVGWFTTVYPVALRVPPGEPHWRELVRSIRHQLRAIPGHGFSFGALRHLGSPEIRDRLAREALAPQVGFNYLGQWDSRASREGAGLYRAVHASLGEEFDSGYRNSHLLEVAGAVQGGELRFSWYYQPDAHRLATVESVAASFIDALTGIAEDCWTMT
jgi:non-ribosomal peptide synthase protein (TIGR01720 family)